jgi:hypothetical protein
VPWSGGGWGPYGLVHVAVELVDGVVEGDEIGQGDDLQEGERGLARTR